MPPSQPQEAPSAEIIELQTRLAYQEQALDALSDELARQQQQIDRLTGALARLSDRLADAASGEDSNPGESEPPPPHY